MEQLKPIVYEFSAYTCSEGGSPEAFYMAIRAPRILEETLACCELILPLRARPVIIHGVDGDSALELARHFVACWLDGVRLVDGDGHPVDLPPVPEAET